MGTRVHKQGIDEFLVKFQTILASIPCPIFGQNIAVSRGHIDVFTFWHFSLQVPMAALHMQDRHWTVDTRKREPLSKCIFLWNYIDGVYNVESNCIMFTVSKAFVFHHGRNLYIWPFYRTQVYLGSDLWVQVSQTEWVSDKRFCRLNWCDSGWWRYQLNTCLFKIDTFGKWLRLSAKSVI